MRRSIFLLLSMILFGMHNYVAYGMEHSLKIDLQDDIWEEILKYLSVQDIRSTIVFVNKWFYMISMGSIGRNQIKITQAMAKNKKFYDWLVNLDKMSWHLLRLSCQGDSSCTRTVPHGMISIFPKLKNLKELNICCTEISDKVIKLLPVSLKKLNIGYCNFLTNAGVLALGRLSQLEELDLSGTYVSGAGLKLLPTTLKKLLLSTCYLITDEGVETLKRLKNLRALDLSNTYITGKGIKKLPENLVVLLLCECYEVRGDVFDHLAHLQELNLDSTDVSHEVVKKLRDRGVKVDK